MLEITPIACTDFQSWRQLAEADEAFYKTVRRADEYERLWSKLRGAAGLVGLSAYRDGRLIGFAHYLFHASCWSTDVCYLQDLVRVSCASTPRGLVGRSLSGSSKTRNGMAHHVCTGIHSPGTGSRADSTTNWRLFRLHPLRAGVAGTQGDSGVGFGGR